MREDPSYFQDAILDWSEYQVQRVTDITDRPHPALKTDVLLEMILFVVIDNACTEVLDWDLQLKDINYLLVISAKVRHDVRSSEELLEGFAHALVHFEFTARVVAKSVLNKWGSASILL